MANKEKHTDLPPTEAGNSKREKIRMIPITCIDSASTHPFQVRDDSEMHSLIESIEQFGVITPCIVRKKGEDRYEMISGHRRKRASELLGLETLPVIVRDLPDDEAVILMVDSNLQREHILPSEKAFAYKLKMEALKRQGKRTDLTCTPVVHKLKSVELIGKENGDSREQVRRYIRLTYLIPELLEDVDIGKIGLRPAVELSYLTEEEQKDLSYTSETVYFYKNVYTVSYDANGGYGAPAAQTKEHGQTLTISTKRPTRYGHAFLGWGETPTATSTYTSGGSFTGDYSTTLYAIWLADRYTIRLNANGGSFSVSSLTKIYGQTLTLPDTVPTRSGYVFLGWSNNSAATTATYGAGGSYMLNRNETLYAVWEKIPETYAVYYNANGGSGAPAWQVKTEGIPLTLSPVAPSRTGYIFMGWATSADSETVAYIPGGTYTQDVSITLYAVWSPQTYTVTYNANGGSGAPSPQTKTQDVVLILRAGTPYREHYKFLGWSTENTAALPTYYPGDVYDLEGNTTLYAVWEYVNYDFSVSDLTVTPNEARQYDTVHVRFRLDSWDQKNAYSDIPVEVILNGGIIYSQTVDFSVYGVNYVDFDLNVGALEGLQTITAWVNRNDYRSETRTGNNYVFATFTVNKVVELKTSYVAPNADYIEGNEVVTSFYVTNSSPSAILPDDHMDYTFEVYTLDASGNEAVVHRDTWSDVVIPGNATNLVYFKWQIPQGSAGTLYWCRGYVNESQAIAEDDLSNNRTEFSRYSVNYEESQTPNTRYESQAPAGYNRNVNAPSEQTGKATWNQWEYVNGSFVLKTYGIQVSSGNPTIRPSDACKTATYSGGKWTMKSGYGITMQYNPVISNVAGYAMPQGNAYTGVQSVYATIPEYGYSTNDGEYRTLKFVDGEYRWIENPDADGNERLHFIPVYVQDGEYVVTVTVTQVWTPAGMITAVRNSVPIIIHGTLYDDFYMGS